MAEAPYPGVIHCFTASDDVARQALDLGLYISISGIVTFKNAADLQATARWLPQEKLLVETDSPFLAPVPHRGKTGEPAFVADTLASREPARRGCRNAGCRDERQFLRSEERRVGKRVSVSLDIGGRRTINKKNTQ